MKKIKMLVAALLIGAAGIASAIDVQHGIKVEEAGKAVLEMGVTYTGLTKAEYAQMLTVETKFVNTVEQVGKTAGAQAAKDKNRVNEYSVTLTGTITTDDGKSNVLPSMVYDKLTLKDVNKIMRANQTYIGTLVNNSEMQASKGKKAWGNK